MNITKTFAVLLFCSLLFTACDKVTCYEYEEKGLVGTWKWVSTNGGIADHIHETPLSTGTTREMRLTSDGKYSIYTNNVLIWEGTYTVNSRKCIHDQQEKAWLSFSAHPDQNRMVESLDAGMLLLSDEAADGLKTKYARSNQSVK